MRTLAPFCSLFLLSLSTHASEIAPAAPALPVVSTAEAPAPPSGEGSSGFSLGLGTGVSSYGGNLGKLYSTSSPVAELRAGWALSPWFTARAGGQFESYGFNAAPNGTVTVNTQELAIAAEVHPFATARASAGFDTYASLGGGAVFRKQTFQDHGDVEKDNALAVEAGFGTNYHLRGTPIGLWAEASVAEVLYGDRHSAEYQPSGIEDLTGLLYSGRLGVKYLF